MKESTPIRSAVRRFKARHPHSARAIRNVALTAAVVAPLALSSRGKFSKVMAGGIARTEKKLLLKQANRRRGLAYFLGATGTTGGIGSPFERWYAGKQRSRQAASRPAHRVTVINKRTGTKRYLEM